MAKKEAKIAEKLFSYNQRYEIALEGIAQANARFKKAKSDLPLMIIEKRIPKVEELQRKSDKLEGLKTRLESYIEYNKSINDYIQNWRTSEGKNTVYFITYCRQGRAEAEVWGTTLLFF